MAHNIATANGRTAMMYTGEVPWHRLGTKLDQPATAREAITAAGLDYEVKLTPVTTYDGLEVPKTNAVVRYDTQTVLGVVRVHHVLPARSGVLGGQRRAGDGQAGAECDHQEGDREADGHGGDGGRPKPTNPERVGELITGLQQVAEDDRESEPEQRFPDGAFEKQFLSVEWIGHTYI